MLPVFSIYGNFFHQFHHLPVNSLFPKTATIWHPELCKVRRAGPESPICGCAVLEVYNRGLRKLDLVTQKFFIKKIFFYHIFPFPYKKILNFIFVSRSRKIFLFVNWKKFTFFYHILEGRMEASLSGFYHSCRYSPRLPLPHLSIL